MRRVEREKIKICIIKYSVCWNVQFGMVQLGMMVDWKSRRNSEYDRISIRILRITVEAPCRRCGLKNYAEASGRLEDNPITVAREAINQPLVIFFLLHWNVHPFLLACYRRVSGAMKKILFVWRVNFILIVIYIF